MREHKVLKIILSIISILVGLLFIFSGLIKANDPSGLAYKMGEFFEVWAKQGYFPSLMTWLDQYSFGFSIAMITFEILAGMALILGYRFPLFSYLILLLTIFFTFLTAYALFSGQIKECGCFGDCIKLQANESFIKDLILLFLISILVFFRKSVHQLLNNKIATIIMFITLFLTLFMQWYVLKHLPFKDCLAYKIGNNIKKEMTPGEDYVAEVYENNFIYENIKSGKQEKFTDKNYPWQDTLNWKFVSMTNTLIKPAQNTPPIKDFSFTGLDSAPYTDAILNYPGNIFVLFVKDVNTANVTTMPSLVSLITSAQKQNIPFVIACSSPNEDIIAFKTKYKLNTDFVTIDGTTCKTAMRTNPGLFLIKNANILGKWSYADYPDLDNLHLDLKDNSTKPW